MLNETLDGFRKRFRANVDQAVDHALREKAALARLETGTGCPSASDHRIFSVRELPEHGGRYILCWCAICGTHLRADRVSGSALWDPQYMVQCNAQGKVS